MMKLAATEPGIPVIATDFDKDHFLFNCQNGVIDLRTGQNRPHDPADMVTKLAPVNYNASATCPLWDAFLLRVMKGNEVMIRYLQRIAGLALTGDSSVQELWFFFGAGANGKSVFVETICGMMGDYATPAAPSLIASSTNDGHPTEIADLAGTRLAFASETEEGTRLRVQLLKRLTGDKKLKGRFMRQDFFEFERTHKLIVITNNPPVIRETSNAIWRRVRIVPFVVTIPEAERDPNLMDKLQAEWPGILNWCIAGCLDWQRNGMQTPEAVKLATDTYRADQDVLAEFIGERCIVAQDAHVRPPELYADYVTWSKSIGDHQPLDRSGFYTRVRATTDVRETTARIDGKATRIFAGIELKTVQNEYRRSMEELAM